MATLTGEVTQGGATRPFKRVLDLALTHGRFVIVGKGATTRSRQRAWSQPSYASLPKGVGAFRKLRLVNVAPRLGLDFRQGAFRYSMAYDQQAMMGGGVCWLDYNGDGWLDLFAVNSYADVDMPEWDEPRRHCRRARSSGTSTAGSSMSARPRMPAIRVKGTGCAAADLNGDGHTDLVVTTATGVDVLWNSGHGTFTAAGASCAVRLVRRGCGVGRERGRPAGRLRRGLHEHGGRGSPARSRASRRTTRASATSSTSTRATGASARSASRAGSRRRTSGTASARSSPT